MRRKASIQCNAHDIVIEITGMQTVNVALSYFIIVYESQYNQTRLNKK